ASTETGTKRSSQPHPCDLGTGCRCRTGSGRRRRTDNFEQPTSFAHLPRHRASHRLAATSTALLRSPVAPRDHTDIRRTRRAAPRRWARFNGSLEAFHYAGTGIALGVGGCMPVTDDVPCARRHMTLVGGVEDDAPRTSPEWGRVRAVR